jgi:hypothetical protein
MTRRARITFWVAGALVAALLLLLGAPAHAAWPYTKIVYSGGPSIDWSNETQLFSSLPATVDDDQAVVDLPFAASLYGQSFTQVTVSTNGLLAFGNVDVRYRWANECLSTAQFSTPVVAAYWDDLELRDDPGFAGAQEGVWHSTSGTAPNRRFVVHWDAQTRAGATDANQRITFEVVLLEGVAGVQTYYQRYLSDPMASGTNATIGIQQGGAGAAYVQHSCNSAGSVVTGRSIAYSPDPPTSTGQPQISDLTPVVGQTLTVSNGTWDAQPDSYEYRWTRCTYQGCTTIPGASAQTYTVAQADVGRYLWAEVRAHNDFGWSTWRGAVVTGTVPNPPAPAVPANTTPPSIAGAGVVGALLTVDPGGWTGSPTAFEYAWYRCEPDLYGESCTTAAIPGANAPTHVLQQADMGGWVFAFVRAQNAGGWSTWVQTDIVDTGFWDEDPADDPGYPDDEGEDWDGDPSEDPTDPDTSPGALRITSLTIEPARFRAARTGGSIAKVRRGARVAYKVNRAALLSFTVKRARPGHKVADRCVAGRTSAGSRQCTHWVALSGGFRHPPGAPTESGAFRFTGRLNGKKLAPGRYRLLARARQGQTSSATAKAAFKIVR